MTELPLLWVKYCTKIKTEKFAEIADSIQITVGSRLF
jgi:hypothetical protein